MTISSKGKIIIIILKYIILNCLGLSPGWIKKSLMKCESFICRSRLGIHFMEIWNQRFHQKYGKENHIRGTPRSSLNLTQFYVDQLSSDLFKKKTIYIFFVLLLILKLLAILSQFKAKILAPKGKLESLRIAKY